MIKVNPALIEAHRAAIAVNHFHYAVWLSAGALSRLADSLSRTTEAFKTLADTLEDLSDLDDDGAQP